LDLRTYCMNSEYKPKGVNKHCILPAVHTSSSSSSSKKESLEEKIRVILCIFENTFLLFIFLDYTEKLVITLLNLLKLNYLCLRQLYAVFYLLHFSYKPQKIILNKPCIGCHLILPAERDWVLKKCPGGSSCLLAKVEPIKNQSRLCDNIFKNLGGLPSWKFQPWDNNAETRSEQEEEEEGPHAGAGGEGLKALPPLQPMEKETHTGAGFSPSRSVAWGVDSSWRNLSRTVSRGRDPTGAGEGLRAVTLLQTMVKTMVEQVVPLQPTEDHRGAETLLHPVEYYSATILQMSGVEDDRLAIWLAALTAFINFVFTLVGVWLVERMGRRKLTLGSLTGTAVALIVLALGFLLSAQVSPRITLNQPDPSHQNSTCTKYSYCNGCMLDPDCGLCYKLNKSSVVESSCIPVDKDSTMKAAWGRCSNETVFKKEDLFWAYNFCPTPYSWTALLGLILYLVFFAPGMGPMPWTVNSEIYPLWARSTGNACSSGVNWVFNVLVSLTFLHTAEYLTYYGAFFLYAGFAALGLIFIYGCLPETKGKKLEEIESLFENRLCTCGMSDSDEGRYIEYIRVKGSNYHLSDNDASDVE
ncbi:MYCT protein, partial [Formicarius rufipectus]|nr:MYCT protein [Formicarius rufipectus]